MDWLFFQSTGSGLSVPLSQSRLLQIGILLFSVALVLIVLTWAGQRGVSHNLRVGLGIAFFMRIAVLLQRLPGSRILFGYLAAAITALAATGITLDVIHTLATGEYD